jgi:DNA-directed RNA polymerase subunit RPC12/RpoP
MAEVVMMTYICKDCGYEQKVEMNKIVFRCPECEKKSIEEWTLPEDVEFYKGDGSIQKPKLYV